MSSKSGISKRYLKILSNKIAKTFEGSGTLIYESYEELAWYLNEKDIAKLKFGINILNSDINSNICLINKEGRHYLDYISF